MKLFLSTLRRIIGGLISYVLLACQETTPKYPLQEAVQMNAFYSLASLQALQKSFERNPENPQTLYQLALWHFYHKDYVQSIGFIEKAITLQEKAEYYLLRAQCQLAQKNALEARKSLQRAYRLQDKSFRVLLFAIQFFIEQSEWQEAERFLQLLEKNYPEATQLTFLKGKFAFLINDTLRAHTYLQKAIQQNPMLFESYKLLSHLYNQQGEPHKAIYWANKGLQLYPLYDSLLLEKALAWQKLEQEDSALVYFQKAYQQNRRLYRASFVLGERALKDRRYTEALNLLENTYRYAPALPKLAYYLGVCYEKLERKQEALQFYEKAIKQDSKNLLAWQAWYILKEKIEQERLQRYRDSLYKLQIEKLTLP